MKEEVVNGKGDMRGQRHLRGGLFDFGGRENYFLILGDCIGAFFGGGIEKLYF
jgi:hypothetical protein